LSLNDASAHPRSPSSLRALLGERFDARTYRPRLLTFDDPNTAALLEDLLASGLVLAVHDRLEEQLAELVTARRPELRADPEAARRAADAVLDGVPAWRFGTWAWYPWSGRLVHLLPRELFRQVRTDRNRDKITREEQAGLLERRIGVIGLSVGNCAALTLAMEGVAGAFRLADFDQLGLSNLNRLRGTVADLGLDKTVLAARQLYEIDPYLDVEIYPQGLTEQTIGSFFAADDSGRGLDLLVEECDTPWVKVAAREHARDAGPGSDGHQRPRHAGRRALRSRAGPAAAARPPARRGLRRPPPLTPQAGSSCCCGWSTRTRISPAMSRASARSAHA
jgi:hypothetical protein